LTRRGEAGSAAFCITQDLGCGDRAPGCGRGTERGRVDERSACRIHTHFSRPVRWYTKTGCSNQYGFRNSRMCASAPPAAKASGGGARGGESVARSHTRRLQLFATLQAWIAFTTRERPTAARPTRAEASIAHSSVRVKKVRLGPRDSDRARHSCALPRGLCALLPILRLELGARPETEATFFVPPPLALTGSEAPT